MKVAIMQPYFLPYIGYFQLINAVDAFVVYDNIQYTKKGWINRNRMLSNGKDEMFSIPLKKDSDFAEIYQRSLSDSWSSDKQKLMNKIKSNYQKAPFYKEVIPLISACIEEMDHNLFNFIFKSIQQVVHYLDIPTQLIISSSISANHSLKSAHRVIDICKVLGAKTYINPIGGVDLYDKEFFQAEGIQLHFLKSGDIQYKQYDNDFVAWLSIMDVLMFNDKEKVKEYLLNVKLI